MLGNLGTAELLIIAIVVLVFFGSKKLNELARGLGESTKEYKKIRRDFHSAVSEDKVETPTTVKNSANVNKPSKEESKKGGDR